MADQNDCSREGEDITPDCRLPGDLIVSILTNLPVKSLLKFKSVSKPWCSLISSRRFIKMHLNRQSVIGNKILLSSHESVIANNPRYDYSKIPPLLSFVDDDGYHVSVCSGLVCLRRYRKGLEGLVFDCFILWNPATRKFRSINSKPSRNIGMGYVEATGDYKIMVWSETHTSVYSLNSDSWKILDNDDNQLAIGTCQDQNPSFLNGRMHWLTQTCTCCRECYRCDNAVFSIVAFDVADEVVSRLGVHDNCRLSGGLLLIQTLVMKGSLSVVMSSILIDIGTVQMEIWVMEEYGVEGSWVKQFTIQGSPEPMTSLISWNDCEIVMINHYFGNRRYDFRVSDDEQSDDDDDDDTRARIIFYDPFRKKKYHLDFEFLFDLRVFHYVESLASVGAEEEIATMKLVEV